MPELLHTILLIDDDRNSRELYQRELGREYQVLACASESEALTLLHNHSVKAIILEPALRSQQGWAFLAMLKTMSQTHTTPVILCSIVDEQRRGFELGAVHYLIKPVLPVELKEVVHRIVGL